jgi:hypothetical protein
MNWVLELANGSEGSSVCIVKYASFYQAMKDVFMFNKKSRGSVVLFCAN